MAVGSGAMRDARDAEDALLLEQGNYDLLVAAYAEVVVQRCLIAAGDDGRDVLVDGRELDYAAPLAQHRAPD